MSFNNQWLRSAQPPCRFLRNATLCSPLIPFKRCLIELQSYSRSSVKLVYCLIVIGMGHENEENIGRSSRSRWWGRQTLISVKRGVAVTTSNSLCRMSLLDAQERFSWNTGHCEKYHNIPALNCLMDSALILIWEYYVIFRSGLIQQTNQNCLFSRCQAWENAWISFTVEPRYNEGSRDWQLLFAIRRFRHIEVLFPIFYHCWDKENRLLCRGRRYMEVRFIEIPLYFW